MEGLNKKTLSFPALRFTSFLATLATILATTVLVACGNDGGGAAPPPPVVVNPNGCVTCNGITSPVVLTTFQAQAADGSMALTNMQLFVQSTNVVPNASGNNYNWYQGPIALQGNLEVRQTVLDVMPGTGMPLTSCAIPAGTYYVQSNGPGQMGYMGTDIMVPSLITTSGAIELSIEAPAQGGYGLTNQGRGFYGVVGVRRVNGVQCSPQFFGVFSSQSVYY
jgi:hypothetical protein